MARAKKKTPHWTKLPRPKLIARAKRLELQFAKLKVQLAEIRETKLLNERAAVQGQADRLIDNLAPAIEFGWRHACDGWSLDFTLAEWGTGACTASHAPNATTAAALEELAETSRLDEPATVPGAAVFPWERRDDAGSGNNQTEGD